VERGPDGTRPNDPALDRARTSPKRRRLRRSLRIAGALPLVTALIAFLSFRGAVAWWSYPANVISPPASTWIEDRDGSPLAAFAGATGQWQLPLAEREISPHLLDAVVAVEDARFYDHGGVDWRSVGGAIRDDILSHRARRGASTITMQLQRLREPAARSFREKLVQAIRATQIEQTRTKRAILVEYLNRAPFGGNLVGAGAASWRYFGKPCKELSLGQAALLAGLPQSPNRLRPDRHPELARARRDHVLDRMLACGMITMPQYREASLEPIDAGWRPLPQELAAQNGLLPTLTRLADLHPGQTMRVNIDAQVQKQSAAAARESLTRMASSHVGAVAVVVLDTPSGNCLAAVSLVAHEHGPGSEMDLTQSPRSSGSTLKPFIYAAAFDLGVCNPRTMLADAPEDWSGYQPSNYDHSFRGRMPAGEALAQSRNLPAISLLWRVGIDREVNVLRAAGFATLAHTPDRYGLPLAVGGANVTPLELAEAYASLARGGQHRAAKLLCDDPETASESSGRSLETLLPGPSFWPTTCIATLNCLADPDRTARICPAAAAIEPAWKTGTSSGHRDAWCAAVTPRRTVVVWLGNPDGSGADSLVGQNAAAPLALGILASCDRVPGAGFALPAARTVMAKAAPIAIAPERASLQLISPSNGQQIIRDPSIPPGEQRCPLHARVTISSSADPALWWFVDGRYLGRESSDQWLWWSPSPGEHQIKVVDEAGHAATAEVKVR
jgi:penicillin-binding protein 1C